MFHHGQRFAGLDLLAFRNGDRHHQPRHRAQQFLAGIGRGRNRHQPCRRGLRFGEHMDRDFKALMREAEASGAP